MPTTSNRGYASPAHGGAVNTWDTDVNAVFNQIDQNFGAVSNVALASTTPVTLSAPQYVCGTIRFSGVLAANIQVVFPSVSGWWVVENVCTGAFYIQLSCGAGNKICAPPGESVDVLTDGSAFRYRNLDRVGAYLDLAATAVPSWISNCTVPPYLLCDGSSFSAVTYPALAALMAGTTLPDTRGRARFNINAGTARLTSTGGIDGNTIFSGGGDGDGLVITTNNLPAYTPSGSIQFTAGNVGGSTTYAGSTAPGPNVPGAPVIITATFNGSAQGGTSAPMASVPPGYIGGITLIRAA